MVVLDVVVLVVAVFEVAVLEVAVLDVAVAVVLEVDGDTDVVEPDCAVTELEVGLVGAAVSLSAEQADNPAAARIAIPRVTLTWEFMGESLPSADPPFGFPRGTAAAAYHHAGGRPLWHRRARRQSASAP